MENEEKTIGNYTIQVQVNGIDEAKENVQELIEMLEKANDMSNIHGKSKAEFTREYCDEILVEVLENGNRLVQAMIKQATSNELVEIQNDAPSKLDSITRFGDFILKARQHANQSAIRKI